jgi:hypothetical protein
MKFTTDVDSHAEEEFLDLEVYDRVDIHAVLDWDGATPMMPHVPVNPRRWRVMQACAGATARAR